MLIIHASYAHDFDETWSMKTSRTPYHIIIFVTVGRLTYTVDDERIELERGDLLYIPSGSLRGGQSDSRIRHQRYSTHFEMRPEDEVPPLFREGKWRKIHVGNFDYFKQRYTLLNQQWFSQSPFHELFCHAVLLELLVILNRDVDTHHLSLTKLGLVMELKKYILNHYKETVKIDDLAKFVDRTPNYVSRIFKEVSGQSPIEYHQYVRVTRAKELLLNSSMSIAEIAEYLGYCDQFYFSKVFKKLTGLSPSWVLKDQSPTHHPGQPDADPLEAQ